MVRLNAQLVEPPMRDCQTFNTVAQATLFSYLRRGNAIQDTEYDLMNDQATDPEDHTNLYRRAFSEFGTQALWNMRPAKEPTVADALAITKALRTHGGMDGRRLAERIEELCRAPN